MNDEKKPNNINNKTLKEFLECLITLTQDNIYFLNGNEVLGRPENLSKYRYELTEVQNLINSFNFKENMQKVNQRIEFSLEVYEDHAIIRGLLTSDELTLLIKFCGVCGFKYISSCDSGFKLTR